MHSEVLCRQAGEIQKWPSSAPRFSVSDHALVAEFLGLKKVNLSVMVDLYRLM